MKEWVVIIITGLVVLGGTTPAIAAQPDSDDRQSASSSDMSHQSQTITTVNNSTDENVGSSNSNTTGTAKKPSSTTSPDPPEYNTSFDGAISAIELQNASGTVPNRTLSARSNSTDNSTDRNASQVVTYSPTTIDGPTGDSTAETANSTTRTISENNTTIQSQVSKLPETAGNRDLAALNSGIIGSDTRQRITSEDGLTEFPWAPVVEVRVVTQDGRRTTCSGAIITEEDSSEDSYHVLTAGHCVHFNNRGGWIDITPPSVDGTAASHVVPAANGSETPFGRAEITRIRSYNGWTEFQNPAYDMALLTLDRRVGDQTGSLGYVGTDSVSSAIYTHPSTRVTGYPGDKPNHTMWTSINEGLGTTGSIIFPEEAVHIYSNDIFGGMSGGPTWIEEFSNISGPQITSVNAYAVDTNRDGETEYNQGTRITTSRFNDLERWMADDDSALNRNDILEPNDSFGSAAQINEGQTYRDLQIESGEWDVFALNLSQGEQLRANISFDDSTGDLDMFLYYPNETIADRSVSTSDDEMVQIQTAPVSGTYYIGVKGYDSASAPYRLSAEVSSGSSVSVLENKMCTNVQDTDPWECAAGAVSEIIKPSDNRAISWLRFGDIDQSFSLTWRYYTPSGDLYKTIEAVANDDGSYESNYKHWSWIDVAGTEAASMTGEWRVEVDVAGEQVLTDAFVINNTLDVQVRQLSRTDFAEIDVYATVSSSAGDPITGLDSSDFAVSENGVRQSITSVTQVGDRAGSDVSAALVIDRSGSMDNGKIGGAESAASNFVSNLQSGDEAAVISFADDYRVDQRWTGDKAALNDSIDFVADGNTELYGAATAAVEEASPRSGRSAVILLTDGEPNSDSGTQSAAINTAQRQNVPVYTIGLGDDVRETELREVATETGGEYYFAPSASDLTEIYQQISQQINNEYRLTYRTTNRTTDGGVRNVEVTAFDSGLQGSDSGRYTAPCAPLPSAQFDTTRTGTQVEFNGSASQANGGDLVAYRWDFNNDGQVDATGEQTTHTYANNGTYEVKLTVEKGCGVTSSMTKQLNITDQAVDLTAQNGLAFHDGLAYLISSGEILTVDLSNRSVVNRFEAPAGRADALAYGDGSLWFADGVDPDYDGEIVELDPETGDVRSRIDTSYDPTGLAYGDGSVWVTDITQNRIIEYAPDGTERSQFDYPRSTVSTAGSGLAYFDGSIWLGTRNGGLHKFASNGTYLRHINQRQTGYSGLATTETALLGPDDTGTVTVLRTFETNGVSVRLSPTEASTSVGASVTYDIVVANVTDGVGSTDLQITLNNTDVAAITDVGVSSAFPSTFTRTEIASDGSSVIIQVSGGDTTTTDTVTVGNVTVNAKQTGPAVLDLSARSVGDESGLSYTVARSEGAQLTVTDTPSVIVVGTEPTTDGPGQYAGDGVHQDVNGDGSVTPADVTALFNNYNSDAVQNNPTLFDYNGDGSVTLADVTTLFNQATI